MTLQLSDVIQGLASQQLPALVTILNRASDYLQSTGESESKLLGTRLAENMHPLGWQIQTTLELLVRGVSRLQGDEPESFDLDTSDFAKITEQVLKVKAELDQLDYSEINSSGSKIFQIPIGPEMHLDLSGNDYVLKFLLPNVYFHLTTAYDILRMQGVELGKRDYMGPIL